MKLTIGRGGVVVLATIIVVSALVAPSIADTRPADGYSALEAKAAKSGIFVRGNEVRRRKADGTSYRFVSRGVIVEGFQFPLEAMRTCKTKPGISRVAKENAEKFCERT